MQRQPGSGRPDARTPGRPFAGSPPGAAHALCGLLQDLDEEGDGQRLHHRDGQDLRRGHAPVQLPEEVEVFDGHTWPFFEKKKKAGLGHWQKQHGGTLMVTPGCVKRMPKQVVDGHTLFRKGQVGAFVDDHDGHAFRLGPQTTSDTVTTAGSTIWRIKKENIVPGLFN